MIISIANQKGGVGKTTLAIHLAVWLTCQGKRVVLVDGDPQGNATSWLLDGDTSDPGLFRLLVVGEPLKNVVRIVNKEHWGRIGLLPGNDRTGEAMTFISATRKPFDMVAKAIRPLDRVANYVLVDMPPSKAAGFQELLFAADWVLVPTQLERLSLEGVSFMARTCQELRSQWKEGPRLLAIVPNMVRQTVEHREQFETLVQEYGTVVWPPIPLSVKVAEACSFGSVLFDHAPGEMVTKAMSQVARRLLNACEEMK